MEAEVGVMPPQAKEHLGSVDSGNNEEALSSKAFRGSIVLLTL